RARQAGSPPAAVGRRRRDRRPQLHQGVPPRAQPGIRPQIRHGIRRGIPLHRAGRVAPGGGLCPRARRSVEIAALLLPTLETPAGATDMEPRRDFARGLLAGIGATLLPDGPSAVAAGAPPADAGATGSDVGSLFPFIRGQAVRGEFPLSYLRDEFRDLPAWK